jgi:FkbM family methyltransferase
LNLKILKNQIRLGLLLIQSATGTRSKLSLIRYFVLSIPRRLGFNFYLTNYEVKIELDDYKFVYLSNSSELYSYKEIMLDLIYEKHPSFNLKYQKVIFDIGANIGFYSLRAAVSNKKSTVYAFEPNPKVYQRLTKNISMNNINNVIPYQLAIGNKSGFIKFQEEISTWTSRIIESPNDDGLIVVPIMTIDDFLEKNNKIQYIDLMKIDVEGFEYETIKGAEKSLKKIKLIVLEYHNNSLCIQVHKYLTNRGFKTLEKINTVNEMGISYYVNSLYQ